MYEVWGTTTLDTPYLRGKTGEEPIVMGILARGFLREFFCKPTNSSAFC